MSTETIEIPIKRLSDKEVNDLKEVIGLNEKLSLSTLLAANQENLDKAQIACIFMNVAKLQMQHHKAEGQMAMMKAEACKRLAGHVLAKTKTAAVRMSPLIDMMPMPFVSEFFQAIEKKRNPS